MSLFFKILDERNDKTVVEIDAYEFYGDETRKIRVQVLEDFDNEPYSIAAGGTFKFRFLKNDNTFEEIGGTIQSNRSIVEAELLPAKLAVFVGGDLVGEVDEGGEVRIVRSDNVLKKLHKDSD